MQKIVCQDFKTLRKAYVEIKGFLEKQAFSDAKISLDTRIVQDLELYGDDNYFLLDEFITQYHLDYENFYYGEHFLSEGEVYNPNLIFLLPVIIILFFIRLLSFGKITINLFSQKPKRTTLDMSFGDMLTWYLQGEYALRNEVKFVLKAPSLN